MRGGIEDHHGGAAWLQDKDGWFLVLLPVGLEWSAQFCAAPEKVDQLRQIAQRLYAGFPGTVAALSQVTGYDCAIILSTPIVDAAGIARWVDSIFNASVPLPAKFHTGIVSSTVNAGGIHHYPKPIVDIQFIKHDDFTLFVSTPQGKVAVTPVAPRGSGDGRVAVVYADTGHPLRAKLRRAKKPLILPADHPIAKRAFAKQGG